MFQCFDPFVSMAADRPAQRRCGPSLVTAGLLLAASATVSPATDWPQWRGLERDGRSAETGLLAEWPAAGPPLAWRAEGLGAGYSSLAVAGGVVFTMGATSGKERVLAFDARSGEMLWQVPNGPELRDSRGNGPRGTPTIDGERVYALGGNGRLIALRRTDGALAWSIDLLAEFGGRNIQWGISESPLIVGDLVLVSPGGRGAGIAAFDKVSGKLVWKSQSDRPGYSSPILAKVDGVEQAIFFTAGRALGVAVENGRLLWEYDKVANGTANVATPIFYNGKVFLSSDYGTGCALLRLGGGRAQEVYFNRDMRNHHASSVLVGNTLYGFSSSILTAMELETGKVAWQDRSVGKGSLIYADGLLYALSERGVVGLIEATPAGYRERSRFSLERTASEPSWAHPAIANGLLFLRDQDVLYAYNVRRAR